MVVAEQLTEALPTHLLAWLASNRHLWLNQLIAKTLMIPLGMIMRQILRQHNAQRLLTQDDHLMKYFLPDRTHKPLTVGIEIQTPWGQDDWLDAAGAQYPVKAMHQFFISVVDQLSCAQQEPIEGIGQLAGTLLHEDVGGMWCDPCHMDTTSGEFHHHEYVVCHQTLPRGDLHREEVRCGEGFPV